MICTDVKMYRCKYAYMYMSVCVYVYVHSACMDIGMYTAHIYKMYAYTQARFGVQETFRLNTGNSIHVLRQTHTHTDHITYSTQKVHIHYHYGISSPKP